MKKGKVNANMIYLKRGGYIHKGEAITSDDVDNFDALVEKGTIMLDTKAKKEDETKASPKTKVEIEAKAKKPSK